VISWKYITLGWLTKIRVAVNTLFALLSNAGSTVRVEDMGFQSNASYGHDDITKPDDLSVKIIWRSLHLMKPSAAPQILLTVSGTKGLNLVVSLESVRKSDNVIASANGMATANVMSTGSNEV
jgi:hypothetical protein